jgi:hypothetical protein
MSTNNEASPACRLPVASSIERGSHHRSAAGSEESDECMKRERISTTL